MSSRISPGPRLVSLGAVFQHSLLRPEYRLLQEDRNLHLGQGSRLNTISKNRVTKISLSSKHGSSRCWLTQGYSSPNETATVPAWTLLQGAISMSCARDTLWLLLQRKPRKQLG